MNQKQVCQLDYDGYLTGVTFADESPLEPGVFLLPARTVDAPLPSVPEGKRAKWDGDWIIEDIPQPPPPPEIAPPPELPYNLKRMSAYAAEADPLFFKAQRGEATMAEWQAKVAEIKARYPKE